MGFWDSLGDRLKEIKFKEMINRLRKGKESMATKDLVETAGFFEAIEKKGKKPQEQQAQPQAQAKVYNPVYAMIVLIMGLGAWFLVQNYTPLGKIIAFFLQNYISTYLPEPWPTLIANWLWGYIILVSGVIYMLAHKFSPSALPAFMQNIGMVYLVISIFFFVGYLGYNTFLSSGALDGVICSGSVALSVVNQVDPNAANRCLNAKQEVPTYDKTGISTLASEQLGGLTGNVPTIFPDETYTLPFTVKNLDTQNYLTGVYVEGKMSGQIRTGGQLTDKLIRFTPSSCTKSDPCDILPGGTQVVSMDSEEPISFYAPSFTDITIYTVYPYTGFGKGEIFEASSEVDAAAIKFPNPQSDPGPVDVVVHFAPNYFISLATGGTLNHAKMFVDIINNGQGNIGAKSMLIKRIGNFADLGPASCIVHGFNEAFSEGTTQEFQNLEFLKGESIQFTCDLSILKSGGAVPEFRGVVFTATFNYDYRDVTPTSLPVKAV